MSQVLRPLWVHLANWRQSAGAEGQLLPMDQNWASPSCHVPHQPLSPLPLPASQEGIFEFATQVTCLASHLILELHCPV